MTVGQASGLGQVFTNLDQIIVEADDRYLEIVGRDRGDVIGRSALSFTYDQDLSHNRPLLDALASKGPAFAITKRYVRGERSIVWVENHVSRVTTSGKSFLHASSRLVGRPFGSDRLARHYALARSLGSALVEGRQRFGREIVSAPTVEALLWLYRAEIEATAMTVADIARLTESATSVAIRWVRLLHERGLVETEDEEPLSPATVVRIGSDCELVLDGLLDRLRLDPRPHRRPAHP